jgi:hypothetical protein
MGVAQVRALERASSGTVGMLGGVLLELAADEKDKAGEYRFVFVCIALGKARAFIWSPKSRTAVRLLSIPFFFLFWICL